jgi:hypothetical protein
MSNLNPTKIGNIGDSDFKVIAETMNGIIVLNYEGHSPETFWNIGLSN